MLVYIGNIYVAKQYVTKIYSPIALKSKACQQLVKQLVKQLSLSHPSP